MGEKGTHQFVEIGLSRDRFVFHACGTRIEPWILHICSIRTEPRSYIIGLLYLVFPLFHIHFVHASLVVYYIGRPSLQRNTTRSNIRSPVSVLFRQFVMSNRALRGSENRINPIRY